MNYAAATINYRFLYRRSLRGLVWQRFLRLRRPAEKAYFDRGMARPWRQRGCNFTPGYVRVCQHKARALKIYPHFFFLLESQVDVMKVSLQG